MIPNHKGEIPVALLLLPFLLGIVAGLNIFPGINIPLLLAAFAFSAIIFTLLNLKYEAFKLYKRRWLGGGLVILILFLAGWIITVRYNELRADSHFSKSRATFLLVRINNEPVLKNGLFRFTADVEESNNGERKTATTGTLLIIIKDSAAHQLSYGDELLVPAKYNAIDPPFNPAEFNYKNYLAHKNIYYQAFLYPKQYFVARHNAGNPLIAYSMKLRQHLVGKLRDNIRDTDAYAVASALVLGYKADLSSDILDTYSKTGTVYVLTVSGAQVAIIYLVLAYSLSFLDRFKHGKTIKAVIIIAIVSYYALLTGFSPAVCRAALMLGLVVIGKTSRRYINTLNILAASAFILLCYDPFFITEAGFQLSYLAVLGAVILRPVVYRWFSIKNKIVERIWGLCSFSIAIQLAIFPLCVLYFHQFPVYFLLSNLLVIMPSAVIMYTGVIFLLLPRIPLISPALSFLVEKTAVLMNKTLAIIEHLPGAVLGKLWFSQIEGMLLFAIVISLFYFWYSKKLRWLRTGLICCLLLFVSFSARQIRLLSEKNIAWLNLKKHPGIVFKNGHSAIVLSDLKQSDKTYKYSIQPYLDSCQVTAVQVFDLASDINTPCLKKKLGLIQFMNTKVFIFDGKLSLDPPTQTLRANYVYITGNPNVALNRLDSIFACEALIIDGSNSDKKIADWRKQLDKNSVSYKLLKRNKYFVSVSN